MSDPSRDELLPKLVAFDLDGTLWYPEMYMLWGGGGAPFTQHRSGNLVDRKGQKVYLLGDTRDILSEIHADPCWSSVKLAISSKTDEPSWAEMCLQQIAIKKGVFLKSLFHYEQISQVSKDRHFRELQSQTGFSFKDMIFFDNQQDNCQTVSKLGVHCVYTPDGLTRSLWDDGISSWRDCYHQ
uniref:Magnesium-dependent phosphatase-1 n=1 Tax=Spongospora subterranea TaxID=70186 RepID=A0A0H5RM81_9EUKA|eukprot:CRZ09809.1 hypothetical protein [Spongospora subterranea]